MTDRELMQQALEALEQSVSTCFDQYSHHEVMSRPEHFMNRAMKALRERLAQSEPELVAWRDRVEQRLLTWRQSFVNRSGDQLALDDFMDKQSLDDLIDFVCDEYTTPPQRKEEPEPVAWIYRGNLHPFDPSDWAEAPVRPLYEAPPQREWQKLTDEEAIALGKQYYHSPVSLMYAVEAKLKEKNG